MRLVIVSTLICASFVLLGACSSAEPAANGKRRANSNTSATTQNAAQPVNGESAETVNSESANNRSILLSNRTEEKIEKLKAMAANSAAAGKKPPEPSSRPAPENSFIVTSLTDVAREVRTFRSHPLLLKVEKIHDGKDGAVKVYMRDGRVFDLPGKSIVYLDQIPSSQILTLVGVAPAQAPVRPTTKTATGGKFEKKPEN